jgi:hypothetical protein
MSALLVLDANWMPRKPDLLPKDSPTRIFVSCQQTLKMYEKIDQILNMFPRHTVEIIAVTPTFNIKYQDAGWKKLPLSTMSVPIVGPDINAAALRLIEELARLDALETLKCKRARYALNDVFVLGNVFKIEHMAEIADGLGMSKFAENVRKFTAVAKMCRSPETITRIALGEDPANYRVITSVGDWNKFISAQGFPENWPERLHFDHICQLFGATDEESKILNSMNVNYVSDGVEKTATMQNYGLRILSKLVGMAQSDMCLTDFINLAVFYMNGGNDNISAGEATALIDELTKRVSNDEFVRSLPYIRYVVHDCEGDDEHSVAFINWVNSKKNRNTNFIAQLPADAKYDRIASKYENSWDYRDNVIRDEKSMNGEALLRLHPN